MSGQPQQFAETESQKRLTIVPLSLRQANEVVAQLHRHHKPARGHKFSIGVHDGEHLVGAAIVGRPVARHYDDGRTLEVNRTCTDGTPNANSCLYGAAWRIAREMGYDRLITYTQDGESGSSLRGAGWTVVGERPARGSWSESSVKLRDKRDPVGNGGVTRTLWEIASMTDRFGGARSGEVGSAVDSDRSAQRTTHAGPPPPSETMEP